MLLTLAISLNMCIVLTIYATEPSDTTVPEEPHNRYTLGGVHPEKIHSRAAYVYERKTGTPVYSQNADEKMYPAAITTLMTMLVAVENMSYSQMISEPIEYPTILSGEFHGSDPNFRDVAAAGFTHGQANLTVWDALIGMMLPSGCDAANMLAYHFGQGEGLERVESFVKMMNKTAKQIGMKNTNFTNPHGLFETDNYSTVYDFFLLTDYAFTRYPEEFRRVTELDEWVMPYKEGSTPPPPVRNSNFLVQDTATNPYYYEHAFGVKTGGLPYYQLQNADGTWGANIPGMANLVSIAERDGFEYIIVTAGAPYHPSGERKANEQPLHYAFLDHRALYGWAFPSFAYVTVLTKTDPQISVTVIDGEADTINLFPQMEDEYRALLPANLDVLSIVDIKPIVDNKEVPAPIAAGAVLGKVEIRIKNQVLETFPLVTIEAVEKTQAASMRTWLRETFFNEVMEAKVDGNGMATEELFPTGEYKLKPLYTFLLVTAAVLTVALIIMSYARKYQKLQSERGSTIRRKPPNRRIRR